MILALDKGSSLYVFTSIEDAASNLEAIDVQQDAFEFCDATGRRYIPNFTRHPKFSRFGPFSIVDIGEFTLVAESSVDATLPDRFLEKGAHIEHTSFPAISSIATLRAELLKRGQPKSSELVSVHELTSIRSP